MPKLPVIAVDGPSGTGKSTLCSHLAHFLRWHLLDSGALYRAIALITQERGIAFDDEAGLADVAKSLKLVFQPDHLGRYAIMLANREISQALRTEQFGDIASRLAAYPAVRHVLLAKQREFLVPPGLIADGRDMGTVVFADAQLKIYLTATAEIRAQRRYKQLKQSGFKVNLAQLMADIRKRDSRDSKRLASPLRPASDAIVVDTSEMHTDDVIWRVKSLVKEHFAEIR